MSQKSVKESGNIDGRVARWSNGQYQCFFVTVRAGTAYRKI